MRFGGTRDCSLLHQTVSHASESSFGVEDICCNYTVVDLNTHDARVR